MQKLRLREIKHCIKTTAKIRGGMWTYFYQTLRPVCSATRSLSRGYDLSLCKCLAQGLTLCAYRKYVLTDWLDLAWQIHSVSLFIRLWKVKRFFSIFLGTVNYIWNPFRKVRILRTQFKTQEPLRFGIDSSLTWGLSSHCPHDKLTSEVKEILLKNLSEVSRKRKWINLFVASEVNGKYLHFAEHKRCSKVA